MSTVMTFRELRTSRLLILSVTSFRHGGVKSSLKMLIYTSKLRFFDYFCLALTKNTYRAKLSSALGMSLLLCTTLSYAEPDYQPLGVPAAELSDQEQWNLTISPDGKNLPVGKGNAAQGAKIFGLQCAACHGPEAIGGSADPLVGEVGSLASEYPEKTVNSYWPYATTLFDYIRRAMPIDRPFSLSADEVYALSAYILSQDGIIDAELDLTEKNLPQVTMPNRDGFVSIHPD